MSKNSWKDRIRMREANHVIRAALSEAGIKYVNMNMLGAMRLLAVHFQLEQPRKKGWKQYKLVFADQLKLAMNGAKPHHPLRSQKASKQGAQTQSAIDAFY